MGIVSVGSCNSILVFGTIHGLWSTKVLKDYVLDWGMAIANFCRSVVIAFLITMGASLHE